VHIIVGLSLVILTGWAGHVSLGQWALVGVGAFVAGNAVSRWDLDFFSVLALGTLAGGVASLLLGLPAQRLSGMMFGVTTLAFAAAADSFIFKQSWVRPGTHIARPMLFGHLDLSSGDAFYYFAVAATALALYAAWNMKRLGLGDVLLSTRDNPKAAEAYGISVAGARRLAFFVSGCFAGFAGVLYAFHQQGVDANRFSAELGPSVLAMVVIGGLGSVGGVVLGATFVRVTQYLLPAWAGFFASGLGLLFVLLVFPGGLGDVVFRLRDRALGRVARVHGLSLDRRDLA
jgi:branched-chain amino acid transport system permease protein